MRREIKNYNNILGPAGVVKLLQAKITRTTLNYSVKRAECQHPFLLRVPSSDVPTYKQVFIDKEYNFNVSTSPEVIIDAGANIGLAAIYFANQFPNAKIIAIEPEKGNFDLLKLNTKPYPNITSIQAALWHKNEEIELLDPGLGNWGFMTGQREPSGKAASTSRHLVPGITVNSLMRRFNLDHINILKIDIEGAEKEVFSETSTWLNKVDAIIVELHERMKAGCNRSFYLGSQGFDHEWMLGENVYLSRADYLSPIT